MVGIGAALADRYELTRLVGRGGMGAVYEATDRETRGLVAVKVLHGHLTSEDGDAARRFRREAEVIRSIQSDHVVRVLDAGKHEATGELFLVTELLRGEDLQTLLDRVGPLSVGSAIRVATQALFGLSAAHKARVIHRDIKPHNLFLARDPAQTKGGSIRVTLLDFGIAKVHKDPFAEAPGGLTTTGILGSPMFMSPEQVQSSRDVGPLTDVWSMGCVLYAALSGRAPYHHITSVGQLLVAICTSAPPPLTEVAPWVDHEIARVVHKAITIDPLRRHESAEAMLDALLSIIPSSTLDEDQLVSSGRSPVREVRTTPPPPSPSVVVVPAAAPALESRVALRGSPRWPRGAESQSMLGHADTLPSGALPGELPVGSAPVRSSTPAIGVKPGARVVTVDPRRILGQDREIWSLSIDVHPSVTSFIARVWKSLRRAGKKLPPMTYGTEWTLMEPRTGRRIPEHHEPGGAPLTLDEAGIRPGAILWAVPIAAGVEEFGGEGEDR